MKNRKEVLVTTTSSLDGVKIKKYLKPVSAHLVAGTGISSDFFASFSDVFGGRSQSYQRQLSSLYDDAIERIKLAAFELGANGVVGLSIDLDEISGKGKSMFMLTAVGTAVVLEEGFVLKEVLLENEKFENIAVDRIHLLKRKREIVRSIDDKTLKINDELWTFITENQMSEVFPFLFECFDKTINDGWTDEATLDAFQNKFLQYLNSFSDEIKVNLIYPALSKAEKKKTLIRLGKLIKELQIFDFEKVVELINSDDFYLRKIGLWLSTFDKSFYNRNDIQKYKELKLLLENKFLDRGVVSTKKQLLSSKEKEIWTCECSKVNEIDQISTPYCYSCGSDIKGFKKDEINLDTAIKEIGFKIQLIEDLAV